MKRRIIAALMCLCMLVGLLPMSAFAADPGTVTAKKELVRQTPDENGNYTIKLTVQGEPVEIPSESAADVVLVVDNSGSMASSVGEPCLTPKSEFESKLTFLWYRYTCPNCGARYSSSLLEILWDTRPDYCTGQKGAEPRIDTAKNVSKTFAQSILNGENDNQLAVIGFAHNQDNGGANDTGALFVRQGLTNDLNQINSAIDEMDADGGTNYSAALQQAYTWLNGREDKRRPAYVIFISDGAPGLSGKSIGDSQWNGSKQAADLKRDGVTLYTIGIALTDDESNYLESLATDSNHYINVTGKNYADRLKKVLLEWASHINSVPAGKNAVMTDVVNTEYFDVVTPLPAGVTLADDGKTLTWNIGNIPKDGVSVEFKIKPKDSFLNSFTGTQTVYTNTDVSLKYKDYKDIDQTIPKNQIGDPTVTLTGTKPSFTVTWKSQDGETTLKTDENVTYGTKPSYGGIVPTKPDDDKYTYTFVGWATEAGQETGMADTALPEVTDNVIYYAAFSKTEITRYSITINYLDDKENVLKTPHSESQKVGFEYSFDVSSDATGDIPFIIVKDEKQYVFNQIKSGSLSGTVAGAVNITAEYLLDSDKDGTPDKYEATVTYKVVNGTWSDSSTTDKTEKFNLKKFNHTTNAWESANPTLGSTIPTGMKPDGTHVAPGAWKDETPVATTPVTGSKTYTYTFNTSVNSKLTVEKTLEKVNGEVYTTGKVEVGDVLTYTVKVTNTGNVSLSNIVVTDTFTGSAAPTTTTEGVTWTLDQASNSYKAIWNVGELAAGAYTTRTYTYTVRDADKGKTITNTAVAKSGTTENGDNNTVDVYNPGLKVNKAVTKVNNNGVAADKPVMVQKDDVLTYTITVQNTGDQDLTNVVVTDTKWSNGTEITVSGVNNPVTLTSNSYTISSLAEDAIVTITYTYKVTDADVTAGEVTNKVFVKSYETPGGEGDETTTKVVGNYTIIASSGANGTISPKGSVTVTAGANQTFTITADAGYHISDVTVDGVSKGAVSSYTFENVQTNHTIHATFAKNSTPTSYTLYYHPNFGGYKPFYQSSSTRNVTVKEYDDVGRLPERDGYVFVSWNTEPDGSGTRYMPGDTFRIDGSSDNLYAQWQKDKTGPDDSGVSNWLETDEHRAYLTGYPDNTFRADRNMTRAEVAQMFYALLLDKNVTITKSFSDVPDDAWYATAVKTLASLGMMDGYPDGTFRPDEPITRAEFATVGLAFAYDPLDASCSYYDVGANAWYHTYVAQATTYGWIGGYPDNTFRPGNNITRVEVCVIVNNMLGRDADERYIDRHEDELVHFVDLSDSYWGYYTIMESTNTHEYTGSFTNEKWTDVK